VEYLEILFGPLVLMLPALVPNSAAVLFGGGVPIDFGRSWRGNRVFGDGKTWLGFTGGVSVGIFVGLMELLISEPISENHFGFGDYRTAVPIIVALSVGSLLGDLSAAFVKRRLGLKRGEKAPILDQYDFVVGALLLVLIINPDWLLDRMIFDYSWIGLLFFLVIVSVIHRGVNIIGYKLGKKDVPW